jgi:hypothetical protein
MPISSTKLALPSIQQEQVRNIANHDLCERALDGARTNWSAASTYRAEVAEAKSRQLTINDCRNALGILGPETATPPKPIYNVPAIKTPSASKPNAPFDLDKASILSESDLAVCRLALNPNRTNWEFVEQPYATWAKEATRRGFTAGSCINMVNENDPNVANRIGSKYGAPSR